MKEKFYLYLRYQFIRRHLIDWGLNPIVGYFLATVFFIGGSSILFYKTEYAPYIYALLAISIIQNFGKPDRIYFLKSIFTDRDLLRIRLIENILTSSPFILFLFYKHRYGIAIILSAISVLMIFVKSGNSFGKAIPTPFFKRPFEFILGFRNTWPVLFIGYALTIIGISVGNFNLAVFSVILPVLISITFYTNLENEYYIFIHSMNPNEFLISKIKTALSYSTLLSLPSIILVLSYYPDRSFIILGLTALGLLFLVASVLGKYSSYPRDINIPNGIMLGFCLLFPPLLLFLVPRFYRMSVTHLKAILS